MSPKSRRRRKRPKAMPADRNASVVAAHSEQVAEFSASQHIGPLPHPDILEGYERICPGAAARVFTAFELQSAHRREMESRVVRGNVWSQQFGAVSALVIVLAAIGAGTWLIFEGKSTEGLSSILGTVLTAGGVGIFMRWRQDSERRDKDMSPRALPNASATARVRTSRKVR